MKLARRHVLLLGGLAVAAAVWAADRFSGGSGTPAPARAEGATTALDANGLGNENIDDLIHRLTHSNYVSVAGQLEELERDLFRPTAAVNAVYAAAAAPAGPEPNALTEEEAGAAEFRTRHTLTGVLLGRAARAVVDNQPLSLHARLDGFELIQIERERVVFRRIDGEAQAVLELAPASEKTRGGARSRGSAPPRDPNDHGPRPPDADADASAAAPVTGVPDEAADPPAP